MANDTGTGSVAVGAGSTWTLGLIVAVNRGVGVSPVRPLVEAFVGAAVGSVAAFGGEVGVGSPLQAKIEIKTKDINMRNSRDEVISIGHTSWRVLLCNAYLGTAVWHIDCMRSMLIPARRCT